MVKPTGYAKNIESTPRQVFQQAACQGIRPVQQVLRAVASGLRPVSTSGLPVIRHLALVNAWRLLVTNRILRQNCWECSSSRWQSRSTSRIGSSIGLGCLFLGKGRDLHRVAHRGFNCSWIHQEPRETQTGRITRLTAAAICSQLERSTTRRLRPAEVRR
jgi:hypothetical protein